MKSGGALDDGSAMLNLHAMVRTCPHCSAANRVPARHLSHRGKCGACQEALPPVDEPLDVDVSDFEEISSQSPVPVLVDFWAAWCGPCRLAAPHVKKVAQNLAGRALVLKVDTDAHPELAARFGVRGIPNFVILRNGSVKAQHAGMVDHRQMEQWLTSV